MIDFTISDHLFNKFSVLVHEKTGINLHIGKKNLLQARVSKILRKKNIANMKEYYEYLVNGATDQEIIEFINEISTNVTHFFREKAHFEYLVKILNNEKKRKFEIWSAACSSGEEPYSIAITLRENNCSDGKIIASDISMKMLHLASKGVYPIDKTKDIENDLIKKYMQKGKGKAVGYFRMKKDIRNMIEFRHLNLIEDFSFNEKFDVIFCRNVMIYFKPQTKEKIINKMWDKLNVGGHLFIGHSETLGGIKHNYQYVQPAIYRKM